MADAWDSLSDFEQNALDRAEEKYAVARPQPNPHEGIPAIETARIFGANFFAYPGQSVDRPQSLIWIHSDRTRFNGLCKLAVVMWVPELAECGEAVLKGEEALNQDHALDETTEWSLQSFGIQCSADSYILGYGDISSPLVVNRKFFQEFFGFVVRSLIHLAPMDERLANILKAMVRLSETAQTKRL
ncbi:MAG: hypothetical protein JNM27_10075 [Leptospirales bacterium]|nr:hypothetical protein [Leptospirales bacterium]